jgi:mRNA-degrading endonuclease RelE of RelBE toxin-antitoxin system
LKLEISERFKRSFSKLSPHRQAAAKDSLKKLMQVPRPNSLNFERVRNQPGFYTIRANAGDRIVLKDIDGGFLVADVGTHDIYRRMNRR